MSEGFVQGNDRIDRALSDPETADRVAKIREAMSREDEQAELERHRALVSDLRKYLTGCAIMRYEPSSHAIEGLLSKHGFAEEES